MSYLKLAYIQLLLGNNYHFHWRVMFINLSYREHFFDRNTALMEEPLFPMERTLWLCVNLLWICVHKRE
jgi:hypothetical protein